MVVTLHCNLESVNQAEMLTTISQIIRHLPQSYQKDFSKFRSQKADADRDQDQSILDNMSAEELWKILLEFLKVEKRDAITYHGDEVYKKSSPAASSSTKKVNHVSGDNSSKPKSTPGGSKQKLTEQEITERRKQKHIEYGKCPVCKQDHTFTTHRGTFASTKLHDCPTWKALPQQQKLDAIIKAKDCTNWRHDFAKCDATWRK